MSDLNYVRFGYINKAGWFVPVNEEEYNMTEKNNDILMGGYNELDNQVHKLIEDFFVANDCAYEHISRIKSVEEDGGITVHIVTCRPGIVIGRRGEFIDRINGCLCEALRKPISIKLIEDIPWHSGISSKWAISRKNNEEFKELVVNFFPKYLAGAKITTAVDADNIWYYIWVLPGVSTESLVEFERKFWESVPDIHKFPAHLISFETREGGELYPEEALYSEERQASEKT